MNDANEGIAKKEPGSSMMSGLRINLYAAGLPFNGDTIKEKCLGGSETAAYYLARELASKGHDVTVWTEERKDGLFDGVRYTWLGEHNEGAPLGEHFEQYARNTPHDILIMQRGAGAFIKPFASKVNIWQLHDLALHRWTTPMMGGMWQVDAVTVVSEFHKKQVEEVWNINPDTLRVVRNGVDRSLYGKGAFQAPVEAAAAYTAIELLMEKIARFREAGFAIALYQSRPERGLEHLLRPGGIMDRIRDLPIKLLVGGYDNTVPQMAAFYGQLQDWAKGLPNVEYIASLSKQDLATLQEACNLMLYPTEFGEVSCITAMEAQCAGLPMLTSDCAAIPETCEGSGTMLIPLKDGKADEDAFVEQLTAWFDSDQYPAALVEMSNQQRTKAIVTDWTYAGDKLDALCHELLAHKLRVPRVLRTAIERSDIDFARWVFETKHLAHPVPQDLRDPIVNSVFHEVQRLYAFTESDAKYATHYRKHQGEYYDSHEEMVIGENVTHTTRYRGVLHFMAEAVNGADGHRVRVLDYGCAHGHYTIPLAKTFRDSEFVGVDISDRAIKAARKWVDRDKVGNATFKTQEEFRHDGRYDVIIAAEVLEHVRDQDAFLAELRGLLAEGGCIIFTTPNGRWEWIGTEAFRTGREHLRQYEREDIVDLCAGNRHEILHAPAGVDKGSFPIGSWVWRVHPELPFGPIDYERKYARYAPRETVSACLIVKDGEKTLRKCVESFVDYVDEVRIFIDPKTSDRTVKVAEDLASDYPNRPFLIEIAQKSATKDGFDEARNESIDGAAGDWILWCDADEEVRRPHLVQMFLRNSMHNGYGFPQVHYSSDPDQVLTTDYPCRLFRNDHVTKFYGVVHEHPESEMGTAVKWSLVRHEIKFLHAGYVDEEVRRLRYERNLPLLVRDRKKYPDRELNKFLMIRDIAQGLMYEHRQTGGVILEHQKEQAQECIQLMEGLVDQSKFIRMITDAMQYYSHAVLTLGLGFDGEFTCKVKNDVAPDLSASLSVSGRFHSREFFNKVISRFSEESTKLYEDRYL